MSVLNVLYFVAVVLMIAATRSVLMHDYKTSSLLWNFAVVALVVILALKWWAAE